VSKDYINKIKEMFKEMVRDDKIYRIWELIYPDWSNLPAFE